MLALTIPLWTWPALCVACLWLLAWEETHRINRRRDNYRAIEAERLAREAAHPLGNADRIYDWNRAA